MDDEPTDYRFDALRFDTGARWLDLLATVGGAYGPAPFERLSGVDRLERWLRHENLTPVVDPTEDDLSRARELREVLRSLGLAVAAGRPAPVASVTALDEVLGRDEPIQLTAVGDALECAPPSTVSAALARLAREAAADLTGEGARRLRTCDDQDCGMLFLDVTGRRRWCSAEVCGVRHRVRAHRRRAQRVEPG